MNHHNNNDNWNNAYRQIQPNKTQATDSDGDFKKPSQNQENAVRKHANEKPHLDPSNKKEDKKQSHKTDQSREPKITRPQGTDKHKKNYKIKHTTNATRKKTHDGNNVNQKNKIEQKKHHRTNRKWRKTTINKNQQPYKNVMIKPAEATIQQKKAPTTKTNNHKNEGRKRPKKRKPMIADEESE